MKIIHFCGGGDVGGAKTHILSLVKELSKHIEVKIISFRPGAFANDARSLGIDTEVVKTGNLVHDVQKVVDIVKSGGYQIIHSHGSKANMFAALSRRFHHLPTVTTVHSDYRLDYLQSYLKRYTYGLINTISLRFIDYHIGVSKNFKDMLTTRNFNPDKIFTVYNGIDFGKEAGYYSREVFAKKYSLTLQDEDVLVGILARLDPVKGLNTFIQAAKLVVEQNPRVKFLIGGEGDERKSLERKVSALGLTENLFFLGWVNDADEFMSNIDINVLTSKSESFPYVILEGVRMKKPTVSSNIGGISDLIDHGENGYLFEAGNYNQLAEDLLKLAGDRALRTEFGEKIYRKASEQFSLDSMCHTQLEIYRKILAN